MPSDLYKKKKSLENTGEKNPMYGGTHTPEAREKIGAAQRGKTISEEHRQRIIEANKGKTLSEEHKKKIGSWERTDEYRKKLSEAIKKSWEKKRLEKLHHAQLTAE